MSLERPSEQICEACRASHGECDSQRPKCSRCTIHAILCVRPETAPGITFINQNDAAANASRRAAHRRAREKTRRTAIPLDIRVLETVQQASTRLEQPLQLGGFILHSSDYRAMQRFVSRWAAGQTALGCLDSMPELLEASGQGSAMHKAILATAYADLAAFERHGDQGTKCYRAYSRSLQRLRDELSSPEFVASDSILATVLAIDAFELLYMGRTDPLGVHTQAILRLLELRRNGTTEDKQSFTLWRSAHQRIYARQLFSQIPSIGSLGEFDAFAEDENRPEVRTIRFVADACKTLSLLEHERSKPVEQTSTAEIIRLCAVLRALMQEAHAWSEQSPVVPRPRRVPFNVQDMELLQVFARPSVIVYDKFWMARDQMLLNICSVKVLDTLIDIRTQAFSSHQPGSIDVDTIRDFLLAAQPDLAALQAKCGFVLDTVPLMIGVVDSNGITKLNQWILNDTGVLTVKSPLNAIVRLKYALPSVKNEAMAMFTFLNAHKHVILQP